MLRIALPLILLVFGSAHLLTRYEYTRRSRRALLLCAVLGYLAGIAFVYRTFPTLRGPWLFAWGAVVGLVFFVGLALLTVEVWRKLKQLDFDRQVAHFREREDACLVELRELERALEEKFRAYRGLEAAHRERVEDYRGLRRTVEEWQMAGGVARIRTLKVQDWEREFAALDPDALRERIRAIEAEGRAARDDPERRAQLRAQWSLARLALLGDAAGEPSRALEALEREITELQAAREARKSELEAVRREIEEWARRRQQFLQKRVVLD